MRDRRQREPPEARKAVAGPSASRLRRVAKSLTPLPPRASKASGGAVLAARAVSEEYSDGVRDEELDVAAPALTQARRVPRAARFGRAHTRLREEGAPEARPPEQSCRAASARLALRPARSSAAAARPEGAPGRDEPRYAPGRERELLHYQAPWAAKTGRVCPDLDGSPLAMPRG